MRRSGYVETERDDYLLRARVAGKRARRFENPRRLMGPWQTLFATQAGVAAAFTGLLFVALSINLKEILAVPDWRPRREALLLLLFPVVSGLVGVLPQTSIRALGAEFLVISILLWLMVTSILSPDAGRADATAAGVPYPRLGSPDGYGPCCHCRLPARGGNQSGLWFQAAAVILCIVAGVGDAWVLLVEILR